MTRAITVRNLDFGLSEKTPRYWYEEDPAKTHFMNALSTTFPAGEAFFVRSVLHFRDRIDDPEQLERIRAFAGQEGVHAREHGQHADLIAAQGYPAIAWLNRTSERGLRFWGRRTPRVSLALTAALEHITAIMARQALLDPQYWAGPMHPDMARLWQWHAMEEAEHKAVAFDVFQQVSGSYALRVYALLFATVDLMFDNFIRWAYFMYRDGLLHRPGSWLRTFRFLWARDGMYRRLIPDYLRWFRRDFHPEQQDDRPLIDACRTRLAI